MYYMYYVYGELPQDVVWRQDHAHHVRLCADVVAVARQLASPVYLPPLLVLQRLRHASEVRSVWSSCLAPKYPILIYYFSIRSKLNIVTDPILPPAYCFL